MSCPYIRSGMLVGALALARGGDPAAAREVADQVVVESTTQAMPRPCTGSSPSSSATPRRGGPWRTPGTAGPSSGPEEVPH